MNTARLLAQVQSLRHSLVVKLEQTTDPKVKYQLGEDLYNKTVLTLLLLQDRVDELERALAKERLNAKYRRVI